MNTHTSAVCEGPPRNLVAERHPVTRRYAAELLARDAGRWATIEASARAMPAPAIERCRPDVLVVDAGDFPACCQSTLDKSPRDRVVCVRPEPDAGYRAAAVAGAAAACISRDHVGDQLVDAILGCGRDPLPPGRRR